MDSEGGGNFFEGRVIECLKEKVIQKEAQLSRELHALQAELHREGDGHDLPLP